MKRTTILLGLGLVTACFAGCTSGTRIHVATDKTYVAELGPAVVITAPERTPPVGFRLGAGDALGEQMFVRYVEVVHADQLSATRTAHASTD